MKLSVFKRFRKSPKLLLLIAGLLFLCFLAYKLAILRTIEVFVKIQELSEKATNLEDLPQRMEAFTATLDNLERIIGGADTSSAGVRQNILNRITVLGEQYPFSITDIPSGYLYREQDYEILINTFVLQGNFRDLLNVLYNLEKDVGSGKVVSSRFYIQKDYLTRKPKLMLAIYLQHIKKIGDEI